MTPPRVPLFDRLPEIYRVRDAEQSPPGQLQAYLAAMEQAFGALHADIAQLHEDLFIDTCDDWVVPYIADLLGTTHLKGEPRTLRADVADTIALRRRKGTLGAVERLAVNVTGWACRAVEMRESLAWTQALNHQRPDAGGVPPYGDARVASLRHPLVPRGGTMPVRDPAAMALIGTPFDPASYTADLRPPTDMTRRVNLPHVAVFLWRLAAYRLPPTRPLAKGTADLGPQAAGLARFLVRFDLDPLDRPVRLFNTSRPGFRTTAASGGVVSPLTDPDAVPGPMLDARLTSGTEAGRPDAYLAIDVFDDGAVPPADFDLGDVGLHLFLPLSEQPVFSTTTWTVRGDNLCAWETGLRRPIRDGELVVDPDIGRLLVGVANVAQRDALVDAAGTAARVFVSYTYAAPGPVGAHTAGRLPVPDAAPATRTVSAWPGGTSLRDALSGLDSETAPVVVEITDSLVHDLDLAAIPGTGVDGASALRLADSLTIRAAVGQRPIVRLARPLAFRPVDAGAATVAGPVVRLEGLVVTAAPATFPADTALITRAAVARLEVVSTTLDPGGHALRSGARAPMQPAMRLANGYGFATAEDAGAFVPTPDIVLQRAICGSLFVDDRYRLDLQDTVIDAGRGVAAAAGGPPAIGPVATGPDAYGAPLDFSGVTCLGHVRVRELAGSGGVFTQAVVVLDNQHGCIRQSSLAAAGNRLPPNHLCVRAPQARQAFVAEWHGAPGYGQLAWQADVRIRTAGPGDDAMGAYGFLLEAHKWANLRVRLAEFMPVGASALPVPVT